MKLLLGCVNSAVSLVGYDLDAREPFWYCPGNRLRVCGLCSADGRLFVASDNTLSSLGEGGVRCINLPGPHENLAHSVKPVGKGVLGVADTGNSRVIFYADGLRVMEYSPLEAWGGPLPQDAIHLNDFAPWRGGILASAFCYQPFESFKRTIPSWNSEGLGVLFFLRRSGRRTLSTVVASGLDCPHSVTPFGEDIYCCSSAQGSFHRFTPDRFGTLCHEEAWHVADDHFLRGVLRVDGGWVLGGSSRRHEKGNSGMVLYFLHDGGDVECLPVAGAGEIYDIVPWDDALMDSVAQQVLELPELPLEGEFPAPCAMRF
ncbi:MAG: hypothetical protein K6F46_10705 [Desulfovibrio sp.]|nr:hypothetical protein [Desulfovibrio sp.]